MTASLIIAGLAALLGSTATAGAIAFAYAVWKDSRPIKERYLDAEDNRRRLLADKGTLTQQLADCGRTIDGLKRTIADLTDRLKVSEARAVHGLTDDELRNALDRRAPAPASVPPPGPCAADGAHPAGPANAMSDESVSPEVGRSSR